MEKLNMKKNIFALIALSTQMLPSIAFSKTSSEIVTEALLKSKEKNLTPFCQSPNLKKSLFKELDKMKLNASMNMQKTEAEFNENINLRDKQRTSANIIKGSAAVGSIVIGGVAFKIGKALFLESRGMIAGLNQIQKSAHISNANMLYNSQKAYQKRAVIGTSLATLGGVYGGLFTYSADIYSKEVPKPVLDAFNTTVGIASANTTYDPKETQKMFLRGHQEILESREIGKSSTSSKMYTLGADFATNAAVDAASSISRMRLYRLEYNYAEGMKKEINDFCENESTRSNQEYAFVNMNLIKGMNTSLFDGKLGGQKSQTAK